LLPLLDNGMTVAGIRDLMAVPPQTEQWLCRFAAAAPKQPGKSDMRILHFACPACFLPIYLLARVLE